MADRPAVRTVPNVELVRTGTWDASTGPVTWTTSDLLSAVAAFDDPGYTRPVVKLGHVDPRFDGQPTVGRIANPRMSDDQQTLLGDLVGVPTWLADILTETEAYPSRSIEGTFGLETGSGNRHQFALTAVALLGVTAPAVSTLADVATLYGMDPVEVAAAAADSLEGTVPHPVTVLAASFSADKVRQAWYTGDTASALTPWAWVVDVRMGLDEPNAVIVDDDEGNLWSIPFTVDGDTEAVTFDLENKTRKRVDYVDAPLDSVAASAGTAGALRARLSHIAPPTTTHQDPGPDAAAGSSEHQEDTVDDSTLAALRAAVGITDDTADESTILAAVTEALNERAEPVTTETAPVVPDGFTLVDADTLGELRTAASRGVEAHTRFMLQDRDSTIAAAVGDGRIARSAVDRYRERWDAEAAASNGDAPDTRALLAALPVGLVPVEAAGNVGDPVALAGDDAVWATLYPTETKG